MAKDKGSSLVKYGAFTVEDAEEDEIEVKKAMGGGKYMKLVEGKNLIRFIPPKPGAKWRRVTYIHYVNVPGAGRVQFVCPRMEKKEPCVVCKRVQQLTASGNK